MEKMETVLIIREVGDFFGSGFTWLQFEWGGKYYRLVPSDGLVYDAGEFVMRVEWMPAQYITPEIYFGGGYIVRVIPKQQQPKT